MGETAAKPYQPSNGTEGDIFYGQWCAMCRREARYNPETGDGSCDIYLRTMAFSIGQPEYPAEWVRDAEGPRCTAFKPNKRAEEEAAAHDRAERFAALPRDPKTGRPVIA